MHPRLFCFCELLHESPGGTGREVDEDDGNARGHEGCKGVGIWMDKGFKDRGDIGLYEAKDARADLIKGLEKHNVVRLGCRRRRGRYDCCSSGANTGDSPVTLR